MYTLTFQVLGQDYLGEWCKCNLFYLAQHIYVGSIGRASHFQKGLKGAKTQQNDSACQRADDIMEGDPMLKR